jgi:hypothetical protein
VGFDGLLENRAIRSLIESSMEKLRDFTQVNSHSNGTPNLG